MGHQRSEPSDEALATEEAEGGREGRRGTGCVPRAGLGGGARPDTA